jgi:hypothetical protein
MDAMEQATDNVEGMGDSAAKLGNLFIWQRQQEK